MLKKLFNSLISSGGSNDEHISDLDDADTTIHFNSTLRRSRRQLPIKSIVPPSIVSSRYEMEQFEQKFRSFTAAISTYTIANYKSTLVSSRN